MKLSKAPFVFSLVLAACGGSDGEATADGTAGGADATAVDGGGNVVVPTTCQCETGDYCNAAGTCTQATPTPNDMAGEVTIFQQHWLKANNPLGDSAKAEARFWTYQELPTDDRTAYLTDEGERCTIEADTQYPWSYKGQQWPAPPFASVGERVTFAADGAPGVVELEGSDHDDGTWYFHRQTPAPLVDESGDTVVTFADFFSVDYAKEGAPFSVTFAGSEAFAEQTWSIGKIPESFEILEPAIENTDATVDEVPLGKDFKVSWSNPQVGDIMDVGFGQVVPGLGSLVVHCYVEDDGEAVLPRDLLIPLSSSPVNILLSRANTKRMMAEAGDKRMFVNVIGRYDRGKKIQLDLQPVK